MVIGNNPLAAVIPLPNVRIIVKSIISWRGKSKMRRMVEHIMFAKENVILFAIFQCCNYPFEISHNTWVWHHHVTAKFHGLQRSRAYRQSAFENLLLHAIRDRWPSRVVCIVDYSLHFMV